MSELIRNEEIKDRESYIVIRITQNYTINRTALFETGRNRRKNKNHTRRRKLKWLRPEQIESSEQISKAKNVTLSEDVLTNQYLLQSI